MELRREASRCSDGAVVRRLLAIALVLEGPRPRTEAAEACGMDRQRLRDWVHHYNEEGMTAIPTAAVPAVRRNWRPRNWRRSRRWWSRVPILHVTALFVSGAATFKRACAP